jgi:thimet oligopeptidase
VHDSGKLIGRFYLDMHPRPDKYNHAAQFDIRTGVKGKQIAEAALVCNLPGGKPGDPGLCDIDDVNTMFHEFGHLMHTIVAGNHRWVGVGGIRTERDFVEAPSQMLEEWMRDPKVLQMFAKHYQTGEPVPTDMVVKMQRAQDFAKGLHQAPASARRPLLSIYDRDPAQVDLDAMMKGLVAKYQPFPSSTTRISMLRWSPDGLLSGLLHLPVSLDREGHVQPVQQVGPARPHGVDEVSPRVLEQAARRRPRIW